MLTKVVNGQIVQQNPAQTGVVVINGLLFYWDEEIIENTIPTFQYYYNQVRT